VESEADDLASLMSEPPNGDNHGWTRNDFGGWSDLETGEPAGKAHYPFVPKNYHGRSYGYDRMKCRCILCRTWKATKNSEYRKSDTTNRETTA